MYIQTQKGEGVVAYDVMNLTPEEMKTIADMDKKIANILVSHHKEFKGKKLYLADDDLFALRGILWAFARYSQNTSSNTFTDVKDEIVKEFNESHAK